MTMELKEKPSQEAGRGIEKEYQIIPLPEDHDFSDVSMSTDYLCAGVGLYHKEKGKIVAYAWYDVTQWNLEMNFIYVLDKEEGHGTRIVQFLFDELDISTMTGSVLLDNTLRPYCFWESLGADIDVEDIEEMEMRCREGWETSFELKKENLFN